jgi:hypothetical protein
MQKGFIFILIVLVSCTYSSTTKTVTYGTGEEEARKRGSEQNTNAPLLVGEWEVDTSQDKSMGYQRYIFSKDGFISLKLVDEGKLSTVKVMTYSVFGDSILLDAGTNNSSKIRFELHEPDTLITYPNGRKSMSFRFR